ncbi:peptide deformylase [Polyangium sp. y55x31]|uniref:peptide deformylase n=1 Tax=Polyangium sp. y55x31 TaxID=3042688 RepID=UPI00248281C1|nr:peptide deformylase [Polyangium sp. y55x31]MDI1475629.1 peptide deformylase [Polyangium sp. y55x31]
MAIRTILHYPDPRLRQKALPVERITPEIERLIDDMAETMYAAPGVGLAATQIGEPHRIFIIDIAAEDEPSNLMVFVNPEILSKVGEEVGTEGCLSFPGVSEDIKRATEVRVRAQGRDGKTFELTADGLLAVAIQHENDHLDGVLMIDRVGMLKKRIIQRKMQKRADATG